MLARKLNLSHLPENGVERRRAIIDFFGEMVFSLRARALEIVQRLLESEQAREKYGRVRSVPYGAVAKSGQPDLNKAVCQISQDAIDYHVQMLLGYLDHTGSELEIDDHHVARFKLIMEIRDKDTEAVISEVQLNHDPDVYFARSWGRWFRLYSERRDALE